MSGRRISDGRDSSPEPNITRPPRNFSNCVSRIRIRLPLTTTEVSRRCFCLKVHALSLLVGGDGHEARRPRLCHAQVTLRAECRNVHGAVTKSFTSVFAYTPECGVVSRCSNDVWRGVAFPLKLPALLPVLPGSLPTFTHAELGSWSAFPSAPACCMCTVGNH